MNSIVAPCALGLSPFASALLCVLLLGSVCPQAAQKAGPRKPFDINIDSAPMLRQFAEAVGRDFEIVKDELKRRSTASGGGTYWLVHVKPKHAGYFTLTHRYNYNESHYSHVEREFSLGVGRPGCRRRPPHLGSYSRFCVTDTIIIPIVINNFNQHQFTLTGKVYTNEQDAAFEREFPNPSVQNVDRLPVNNMVADHMQYVGSTSHKMLHRNGGYTLEAYAEFEAQRPGRFNLALGVAPGVAPAGLSGLGASGNFPIIIVARDTPVTLLASRHEVRGYTKGYDGREYVSSTSGDSFMTELIILQPGDRISFKYLSRTRSRDYERSERTGDSRSDSLEVIPPPLILKRPFALRTEYNFTEWLSDYLPQ